MENVQERTKNIGVLLTPNEAIALRIYAAQKSTSVSSLVRQLILDYTPVGDSSFFAQVVPGTEHVEPLSEIKQRTRG